MIDTSLSPRSTWTDLRWIRDDFIISYCIISHRINTVCVGRREWMIDSANSNFRPWRKSINSNLHSSRMIICFSTVRLLTIGPKAKLLGTYILQPNTYTGSGFMHGQLIRCRNVFANLRCHWPITRSLIPF